MSCRRLIERREATIDRDVTTGAAAARPPKLSLDRLRLLENNRDRRKPSFSSPCTSKVTRPKYLKDMRGTFRRVWVLFFFRLIMFCDQGNRNRSDPTIIGSTQLHKTYSGTFSSPSNNHGKGWNARNLIDLIPHRQQAELFSVPGSKRPNAFWGELGHPLRARTNGENKP